MRSDSHNEILQGRHFHARPAIQDDIPFIAARLREGDRLEVERYYQETPEEVLRRSRAESIMVWTAVHPDGTPVAMWGAAVNRTDTRYGIPWMMGTDLISESYGDFLWMSRRYDRVMSKYFLGLANLVDAEYAGAIRWLTWLKYQKGENVISPKGYEFVLMYKDTGDVR